MNLQIFTAKTMAEALIQVRQRLGAHAVILHTRTYKRGGVLGVGARTVVEVTAADGRALGRQRRDEAQRQRQREVQRQVGRPAQRTATKGKAESRGRGGDAVARPGTAGDLIRRTYAAAKAEMAQTTGIASEATSGGGVSPVIGSSQRMTGETPAAPSISRGMTGGTPVLPEAASSDHDQLAQEMHAIKRMVARMMSEQKQRGPASSRPDLPDKLFDQYLALLEQEVAEELAEEIMKQVRDQLDEAAIQDEAACRRAVREAVAALLPADDADDAWPKMKDGRPRTIALVGPTGVGKTTTIAKLAATFKLKQKKKVGLITLDTYRIAAVDQLRTYAGIIGVPLHVATSPQALANAVAACGDCDAVLIDTAGRSQRDDPHLQELATFLDAAQPHEVHLVLSSTCTQSVLMDTVERFSKIRTDRIIFTKLDEAVTFGVMLNVMRKVRKRLSYVTTGQEVPHQIEPGRPDRLAALVLGAGVAET